MSNSSSSSSLSDVALSWLSEDEDVMAADDDPDEPELACSSSSSDVSTMLDTMLGSSFAVLLLAPFSQRCFLRAAWLLSRNAGMAAAKVPSEAFVASIVSRAATDETVPVR